MLPCQAPSLIRSPAEKGNRTEHKSRVSLFHSLDLGGDDPEYESDPEETLRSLVMRRRRAASDDEEDRVATDGGPREDEGEGDRVKCVVRVQSDESEGEGAAPEYDEDEDEEEDYGEGEVGYHEDGVEVVDSRPLAVHNDRVIDEGSPGNVEGSAREEAGGLSAVKDVAGEWGQDRGEEEEEENPVGKKENELFAVPTAGHLPFSFVACRN